MLLGEKGMDCFNWKSNILLRSLIRLLLVYDKKIHTTLWMDIIGWSWFNFMYIFDEIVFQLIRYIYSIYLLVFIQFTHAPCWVLQITLSGDFRVWTEWRIEFPTMLNDPFSPSVVVHYLTSSWMDIVCTFPSSGLHFWRWPGFVLWNGGRMVICDLGWRRRIKHRIITGGIAGLRMLS